MLREKKKEQKRAVDRLKNGLDKLDGANKATEEMQVRLIEMQPQLEKASEETAKLMEKLTVDKAAAEETQKSVSAEEAIAAVQQAEATKLATEAEAAVSEANISLEATLAEVQKLKKDHLVEIKSLTNPPKAVRVTLGAVVILNQDTVRKKGGQIITKNIEGTFGQKEEDYFETAKRFLLNDSKELLDMLKNYDREAIPAAFISTLEKKIIPDPDFQLERAKTCSYAVQFLYSWARAMYDFNKVFLETKPLRDKLADTQHILSEKTSFLKAKKDALDLVNQKIRTLEQQFNEKIRQKEELTAQINDCEVKLVRAQKLTTGLSDEQKRWAFEVK